MTHLTPNELIDAMERVGHHAHLAECEHCRRQVDDLAAVVADAQQASVPEPTPLFWQQFSGRVRTAIERDPRPAATLPAWPRWQVLLPLGAVAMIILALMVSVPRQNRAERERAAAALDALDALDAPAPTASWMVLADLVGEMDLDTATAAGVVAPGIADQAVLQLTADEQRELTRLLNAELTRAKS